MKFSKLCLAFTTVGVSLLIIGFFISVICGFVFAWNSPEIRKITGSKVSIDNLKRNFNLLSQDCLYVDVIVNNLCIEDNSDKDYRVTYIKLYEAGKSFCLSVSDTKYVYSCNEEVTYIRVTPTIFGMNRTTSNRFIISFITVVSFLAMLSFLIVFYILIFDSYFVNNKLLKQFDENQPNGKQFVEKINEVAINVETISETETENETTEYSNSNEVYCENIVLENVSEETKSEGINLENEFTEHDSSNESSNHESLNESLNHESEEKISEHESEYVSEEKISEHEFEEKFEEKISEHVSEEKISEEK